MPPTSTSTKFHYLRVYYQIMVWMGTDDGMDALDWGWNVDNNQMVPIMTDMKAGPDNLLKMIPAIANRVHLTVVARDMG